MMQQNKDRMGTPALHYYGKDITFNELAKRVGETAKAFAAAGVAAAGETDPTDQSTLKSIVFN